MDETHRSIFPLILQCTKNYQFTKLINLSHFFSYKDVKLYYGSSNKTSLGTKSQEKDDT